MRILTIRKGRVMCLCWNGDRYGCNPKVVTDYIASDSYLSASFDIWYGFKNVDKYKTELPSSIHPIEIGSLEYYKILYTSQFVISNTRCSGLYFPYKKKGQLYIFTGHGGSGIKKIEFDTQALSAQYLKNAQIDSSRIDLFLSGSTYRTRVIRSAYRYHGEVLEMGIPRNDMLVNQDGINQDDKKRYLIYAPTFRSNKSYELYKFNVDRLVSALENRFDGEWYIRVSSHPNMITYYRDIYDFTHPRMIDIGAADIQSYLCSSDVMLTDYSSAEMDFSLLKRPVFQLCQDRQQYDRGFYINPEDLPFPYAESEDQLIDNILSFDNDKYRRDLEAFNRDVIGLNETGHATEAVVKWMEEQI